VSVLVALTAGLVFWITAWAFGAKSFDAFMVVILFVVIAAAVRAAMPSVNQLLGRDTGTT
jgi:hypothetical protein